MKLLTFYKDTQRKLGAKTDKGIVELPFSFEDLYRKDSLNEIKQYIKNVLDEKQQAEYLLETDIDWGPCVPNPGKIICVGLNYRRHAEETNSPVPEYPILFNKFANTLTGHNKVIEIPAATDQLDYEAELVIVIGKETKNIAVENALDNVLGYCAVNDLSARDLQFRTNQWLLGKTCDDFSPLGPYLVTGDEIKDPNQLSIKAYVNGELRQDSHTSDMIFNCDYLVSYISQFMTLSPGDIILTGTPEGVVLGLPEDKRNYLQPGDTVSIEIEELGVLTNTFK